MRRPQTREKIAAWLREQLQVFRRTYLDIEWPEETAFVRACNKDAQFAWEGVQVIENEKIDFERPAIATTQFEAEALMINLSNRFLGFPAP